MMLFHVHHSNSMTQYSTLCGGNLHAKSCTETTKISSSPCGFLLCACVYIWSSFYVSLIFLTLSMWRVHLYLCLVFLYFPLSIFHPFKIYYFGDVHLWLKITINWMRVWIILFKHRLFFNQFFFSLFFSWSLSLAAFVCTVCAYCVCVLLSCVRAFSRPDYLCSKYLISEQSNVCKCNLKPSKSELLLAVKWMWIFLLLCFFLSFFCWKIKTYIYIYYIRIPNEIRTQLFCVYLLFYRS